MADNELNNVAEEIVENAAEEAKKTLTITEGDMVDLKLSTKSYALIGIASAAGVVTVYAAIKVGKKVGHWVSEKIDGAKEKHAAKKAKAAEKTDVEVSKK